MAKQKMNILNIMNQRNHLTVHHQQQVNLKVDTVNRIVDIKNHQHMHQI